MTPMTVFVAAPGAGKSERCKILAAAGVEVLGFDKMRGVFGQHVGDQAATAPVLRWAVEHAIRALREGRPVVLDATSSTPKDRATWIGIGSAFQVPVVAVVLRAKLEVCRQRNARRVGPPKVPDEWLTAAWEAIDATTEADLRAEGFTKVLELTTDGPAGVQPPQRAALLSATGARRVADGGARRRGERRRGRARRSRPQRAIGPTPIVELLTRIEAKHGIELEFVCHLPSGTVHVLWPPDPDEEPDERIRPWGEVAAEVCRTGLRTVCGYAPGRDGESGLPDAVDQLVDVFPDGALCPRCRALLGPWQAKAYEHQLQHDWRGWYG